MAVIDFTNAVLDVNPDITSGYYPLRNASYMGIGNTGYPALYNDSGVPVSTNHTKSIISNTPTKVSILFTGLFYGSGTQFFIVYSGTTHGVWKVSNISFNDGDSYSFVIDIEVSGNS